MERRAFLALALSLLVLFAYQLFVPKPAPTPTPEAAQSAAPANASPPSIAPSPTVPGPAAAAATDTPAVGAAAATDVRIENENVIAVFTNRGARLKSWQLKKYKDARGEPLELVATDLADTQPLPFTLKAADDETTSALTGALFEVRGAPPAGPIAAATTVTFAYKTGTLEATKAFTLEPSSYTLNVKTQVLRNGAGQSVAVMWGPGLGDRDAQIGRSGVKPEGIYAVAGDEQRMTASAIAKQPWLQQTFDFVGIDDHYFASFVLKPGAAAVQYSNLSLPPVPGVHDYQRDLVSYAITPGSADQSLTYYIGPKDFDELAAIDPNLTKVINFGMFSVIVVPLLRTLQWLHNYIGNYGWAITVLTILISIVLFPLNHKSVVSMRKMQEVQPEAKAIQERYAKYKATDPERQKMNQELMALYKKEGVNPASGCIPILLTLPVFLAFYAMLQTAIELRGAPFIGWIHDLSGPDPYYVLPALVALSQFVAQWMTPAAGMDPAQQKMMLFMPLVMGFLFIQSPAGALLYWLVSGVFRIGQMQLTNYMIGPAKVRTARPAAERRVKSAGQGKTDAAARKE
jgi:YidC/Oxa1 family membrane protein insertase